ncbi:MAG: hypothetical protein AAF225_12635 [Pseudomonadota bacterium]
MHSPKETLARDLCGGEGNQTMDFIPKVVFGLAGLAAVLGVSVWLLGTQQPSYAIQKHATIIFVALRSADRQPSRLITSDHDDVLWRGRSLHNLIGPQETYWTEFALLPEGSERLGHWKNSPGVEDIYAAEVTVSVVPNVVLGFLRLLHRAGIRRRPNGPLPDSMEAIGSRKDIMPTEYSAQKTLDPSCVSAFDDASWS